MALDEELKILIHTQAEQIKTLTEYLVTKQRETITVAVKKQKRRYDNKYYGGSYDDNGLFHTTNQDEDEDEEFSYGTLMCEHGVISETARICRCNPNLHACTGYHIDKCHSAVIPSCTACCKGMCQTCIGQNVDRDAKCNTCVPKPKKECIKCLYPICEWHVRKCEAAFCTNVFCATCHNALVRLNSCCLCAKRYCTRCLPYTYNNFRYACKKCILESLYKPLGETLFQCVTKMLIVDIIIKS